MQKTGEAPTKEFHGLPLQFQLPALIVLKDWPWAGAKGAMVQEDHVIA